MGAAVTGGYLAGSDTASANSSGNTKTITAPPANSIRILYSLDQKNNDKELIALIDAAKTHIYFAIYEFTLRDVADALVRAKERGVEVRGLVDAGESANSYDAPIISELTNAHIPIETEKHADGNGIMHIKALVTDTSYAIGSFNWTNSATRENDEILEIGTNPVVVRTYETLLLRLLHTYKRSTAANAAVPFSNLPIQEKKIYAFTEAQNHVGEHARVYGTLIEAYTSPSGTVFLDFCVRYKSCPFSGIIFAGDVAKFGNLSRYTGKKIILTGTISSYQGRAEMKLTDSQQLK